MCDIDHLLLLRRCGVTGPGSGGGLVVGAVHGGGASSAVLGVDVAALYRQRLGRRADQDARQLSNISSTYTHTYIDIRLQICRTLWSACAHSCAGAILVL